MSNLLPTLLFLFVQESSASLDDLLGEVADMRPAAVLNLADRSELLYEDGWQDAAVEVLAEASPNQKLLIARLLTQSGDLRGGPILLGMLDEEREPSLAALATIKLGTFDADEKVMDGIVDYIGGLIPEDDAELYCEACLTLSSVGDGANRRAALRYLQRTRESADERTRRQGALALGRTRAVLTADVVELLEEMANGFGSEAAIAASLLDQQEQRERFRSKLEAIERARIEGAEARAEGQAISPDDVEMLETILEMVRDQHMEGEKFSREELIAAAADGMLKVVDPYSTHFTGEEYGEFWFDLNPEYGGIGAYVRTTDGVFTIVRPIYSGPAFEAGLLSGDKVLSVDGWSTADQPDDEIIKRLKGPPGTAVGLEVFRDGWAEPREYQLGRRKIELPVLQAEMLPDGVLYLELISFTVDCGRLVAGAIRDAQEQGDLRGVVLDLRNNPGGSLEQAVAICDVFLDRGKLVVTTRARIGEVERHATRKSALVDEGIPLTVLINEYSASASEIVAGAMSVHGRATTIGERTHGKGSVQVMRRLPGLPDERYMDGNRNRIKDEWEEYEDRNENGQYDFGPRVKLTVAYYFLPDGSTIHTQRDREGRVTEKGGVQPDETVEFWRYEPIVLRELDRLIEKGAFRDYAENLITEDIDSTIELAEYDGRDVSRYEGWADFYVSLETFLDEDVARQWVRRAIRNSVEVSDQRGRVFPGGGFRGDFQEDPQLEAAIRRIMILAGRDTLAVPEYAAAFGGKEKTAAASELSDGGSEENG
ncbi:MAG: S41 family peptidase [Planctomycetes bacterium]|nr:S41 family peptidase [Planctomycetota bacterium]